MCFHLIVSEIVSVTSHLITFKQLNKALYSDSPQHIAWKLSIILYNHPKTE